MANEGNIIRSVIDDAVQLPHVASPAALDTNNREEIRGARELEELQARIQFRIAQINADPNLSTEDKMGLVARLEGALQSGDSNRIIYALNSVSTAAQAAREEESSNQVLDESYNLDNSGYNYDRRSRGYMNQLWQEAISKSPELRAMMREVEALPPAEKELAENELRKNWLKSKEMLADEKLKPHHEQIEIMRGMGAMHSKEAAGILKRMEEGASPEDIAKSVQQLVSKKVAQAEPIINNHIAHIPQASQTFLKSTFGKDDGTIDAEKLMKEWGKTKPPERDKAFKAMVEAGNDITKLPPEQQRIIHMSQVMVAVDGASVAKGTLEIVARNKEVAKYLTDERIPAAEREAKLSELLKEAGISHSESAVYKQAVKQAIHSFDDMAKAGTRYDGSNAKDFSAGFIKEYKDNMLEVAGHQPTQADVRRVDNAIDAQNQTYGYADSMRFIAASKADLETPDWAKTDPTRRAQYEASQAEWKAIDERLRAQDHQRLLEANGVTEAEIKSAATAGQNDAQITASTADFMKEYNARTGQQPDGTTVAQSPASATPASAEQAVASPNSTPASLSAALPPDFPPLAALGITGGATVTENGSPTGGKQAQQGVDGLAH